MKWILLLTTGFPGQPPATGSVGLLIDEDTCKVAGAGMTILLEQANPGLTVRWTCLPASLGAPA